MFLFVNNVDKIEQSVIEVAKSLDNNCNRKRAWFLLDEQELFNELVLCILSSRVEFEIAQEVNKNLIEKQLLVINSILVKPELIKSQIVKELKKPIYYSTKSSKRVKYIFYESKPRYIINTCLEIYYKYNTNLKDILINSNTSIEAREYLIELCTGIGLKQASMFLRNIFYSRDLAIIDTHILDYLRLINKKFWDLQKNITHKEYLTYERFLNKYATSLNISLNILDIAIWVVVRFLKKEYKWT